MPEASTSFVMTNLQGTRQQLKKMIGNLYGLRTWVEYGFRQCKQELGWTDYRFTNFPEIEKWWEIIFCGYLMVSLSSPVFQSLNSDHLQDAEEPNQAFVFSAHPQWNHLEGWKNVLNNLRLIMQPMICLGSIFPWLDLFPNRHLLLGFHQLVHQMNQFHSYFPLE